MTSKHARPIGEEREIPPPKDEPGMRETDDHAIGEPTRGGHQPMTTLDEGIGREHLSSPSQGARPVETTRIERSPAGTDEFAGGGIATGSSDLMDDEAAGGGPSGEEDAGSGPAFEGEGR